MSDSYHLGFTHEYLEACTDLKLMELQDVLLRERPEDRRDDRHAVSAELAKRQHKARERRSGVSVQQRLSDHLLS